MDIELAGARRRPTGSLGGGYRRVRVAGDELVHYAAADTDHTIGCERAVIGEWTVTSDETDDRVVRDGPRCGPCVVDWMDATGQLVVQARCQSVDP